MKSVGFRPVARADARVLILGSLPGSVSLQKQEYYGQVYNSFWPIMGKLAGALPSLPYEERTRQLIHNRIALWDVCKAAQRPGSLDSAIDLATVETNDFAGFFPHHPDIRLIVFNGAKAAHIYERKVLPFLAPPLQAIPRKTLPSTSPAHAGMKFEEKLARWQSVTEEAAIV